MITAMRTRCLSGASGMTTDSKKPQLSGGQLRLQGVSNPAKRSERVMNSANRIQVP
ncbi:MAG: hypothetical protein JWL62_3886 [Hyphomicrobiales bacterium]|nr:hypothetical protein [Hyphomicrobiales bacterium]